MAVLEVTQVVYRNRRSLRSAEADACETVLVALRQIIHGSDLHSKRVARESGLTIPQIVVLQSVRILGEVTTGQVCQRVSLSRGTVTSILDRLELRGLIKRYRSKTDRRVVHTRLTKEGKTALRKAPPLLHERFLEEFEDLPERRQREIVRMLQKVAEMMGAADLDPAPLLEVGPIRKAADPQT